VEIGTHLKTAKITLNIFAVYCDLGIKGHGKEYLIPVSLFRAHSNNNKKSKQNKDIF
jgi:hypothetical protein